MKRNIVCLSSSTIVLLCTLQAFYWPLLSIPGTVIEWWQVGFLAKVGFFVGAPVLVAVAKSPFSGLPQTLLGWSLAFMWAAVVFFVLRAGFGALSQRSRHAA
ncbi:MAG: hypothetical protein IPM27_01035 [Nitrosomonadales bacterium]|nr:hypothetical protein [Nitrosomonadales bacterium]